MKQRYPVLSAICGTRKQSLFRVILTAAASVIAVYDVTGDFDAVIIAKFKDRNSLNTFLKHLSTTPFVKRTATNVALTMVKEDFRLKL